MGRLKKVLCWLLCLVMLTSAVACPVEKSASGQKVAATEVQQEKPVVTTGKHREKLRSSPDSTPDKVVTENNSLALVVRGCAALSPCRNKVAEQLLEIGAKAGIAGLAGVALKDVADRMTSDELDHLVMLEMMGNDEITGKYLSALQDKYGSESASTPNVGKDLTDQEKAEIGGAGSGTPGGWEPQDEENARDKENNQNNNFDRFNKDDLISSANKPINEQGLSAAARAWEKHAGRPGGVFEPLKGNPTQKSEAANRFVNEVLNNKNTIKTDLSRGGVEYRLPDGRGIRYNSDGSFSGFLDPKKPR